MRRDYGTQLSLHNQYIESDFTLKGMGMKDRKLGMTSRDRHGHDHNGILRNRRICQLTLQLLNSRVCTALNYKCWAMLKVSI